MQTNRVTLYAVLLGLLATPVIHAHAQTTGNAAKQPSQLAGPGPREIRKPGGPGEPPAPRPSALTSLTTLTGTVNQLTANEDGMLNGLTLNAGASGTAAVRFAANLGQQINAAVKTGNQVTVTGYAKTNPQGETTFQLVKLNVGKTQIVDMAPAKFQAAPAPVVQTVAGKVVDYQLDREGRASALIMSDQTVVKVPPHVAAQLATLVPKGSSITVDGYVQPVGEGQLQLQKHTILRASVLTTNGQSYLVL